MIAGFDVLVAAVQHNCHVSDARHAGAMTMCTYLLEMREYYRWESGAAQTASLPRAEVGSWLSRREALWASYEDAPYRPVPVHGTEIDPFDAGTVNRALVPEGLVYGAGVGRFGKPQFFLAALERDEWREGLRVLVARHEYARDLAPAAAAARDGTIHVRLESLRRILWEKAEAWATHRRDGALQAALEAYGFGSGTEAALERMADAETETLILHELGEIRAGHLLGPQWEVMLGRLTDRRAELFARAARDHLADCLVTLPALVERNADAALHFWFASLDGMRLELFPRLRSAYAQWRGGDRGQALRTSIAAGATHWQRVCLGMLAHHADAGPAAAPAIAAGYDDPATRL